MDARFALAALACAIGCTYELLIGERSASTNKVGLKMNLPPVTATDDEVQRATIPGAAKAPHGPDTVGYWWKVRAVGPGHSGGEWSDWQKYAITPERPKTITPIGLIQSSSNIPLTWSSTMSGGGKYAYAVFAGPRGTQCKGLIGEGTVALLPAGTLYRDVYINRPSSDVFYSWRVSARDPEHCSDGNLVSECASFWLPPPPPPQPPPPVSLPAPQVLNLRIGTQEILPMGIQLVTGADNYHFEVYQGALGGNAQVVGSLLYSFFANGATLYAQNQELAERLGTTIPPPWLFEWLSINVYVASFQWRVAACLGTQCGPFSPYQYFAESIQWPY